jgi:hypothetical protein
LGKKKDQPKQIHFFCDKCGFEVPQDAKCCPGCGRSFSSVKCPSCGFTGEANAFGSGCPVCGYSASKNGTQKIQTETAQTRTVQSAQTVLEAHSALNNAPNGQRAGDDPGAVKRTRHREELPVWIYIITGTALLVSLVALYYNIR